MNKKNYLIIGITILFFIITIIAILLSKNNKTSWISQILESQNYTLNMKNCNGREKELEKNTLTTIDTNWNKLSNNGPWTGNNNICYTTITISYENNGIINKKEILLLDESSIVLIENNTTTYYTNANEIINALNLLFAA